MRGGGGDEKRRGQSCNMYSYIENVKILETLISIITSYKGMQNSINDFSKLLFEKEPIFCHHFSDIHVIINQNYINVDVSVRS